MATEREEAVPGSPWYAKFFEYWRNRNRVGPGKVELPDCDFFIVGPRRTLRILKPTLKRYYENTNDRPESIIDNFFTRWSRRPHSSGNCRCSFRQSKRVSTAEEQIISDELNRIRTSLCEADKNERAIEELEQRVSVNLQKLQVPGPENEPAKVEDKSLTGTNVIDGVSNDQQAEEQTIKNKIVKDLEKYINVLLEEILDDTVKYVAGANDTLVKDVKGPKNRDCRSSRRSSDKEGSPNDGKACKVSRDDEESFNDISFSFHAEKGEGKKSSEDENQTTLNDSNGGYVNRGFIGSTNDPDSLDFYLRRSIGTEVTLEQLDCIDSGINSVETIEFQPDQEPSLEQSLLKIIDEKLGRTALRSKRSEVTGKNDAERSEPEDSSVQTAGGIDISTDNLESAVPAVDLKELEETVNEPSFEKLRLEFKDNSNESSWNEKMGTFEMKEEVAPIELEDYRKSWPNIEENPTSTGYEPGPRDLVTFRKNRKPMIVFLHGFGSSAEIFEHQLQYFSALGYPCIAPEMLGHGMSSAPGGSRDYHFSKLLKDLDTILCHYAFKPGQKCVLVAHNYGCSFAAALACKYDSSIHQLVLISGGGPTPLAAPSTESAGHCCLRAILAPFLMCGLHRDILYSARGRQHPYCGPEPPEQWPSHMKYVLDGMVWPEGDYVFHRRICTPTLLIHGLRDNKTMMKAFLEAIPTAGHTPMTDCPEQINHMIHCFIDLWKNKKW
ncbi:Abhydrolase domain-containing protein 8 [Eufriesea mexicana]|uniref:acylglycerol lipase n=1 Tax=Eufriesea mexicana TaxID=516756 RepID=A0A310SEH6_9HYME|nr:Abhydrolase domain-containing protein 8 [Eufriesea mexicana]